MFNSLATAFLPSTKVSALEQPDQRQADTQPSMLERVACYRSGVLSRRLEEAGLELWSLFVFYVFPKDSKGISLQKVFVHIFPAKFRCSQLQYPSVATAQQSQSLRTTATFEAPDLVMQDLENFMGKFDDLMGSLPDHEEPMCGWDVAEEGATCLPTLIQLLYIVILFRSYLGITGVKDDKFL